MQRDTLVVFRRGYPPPHRANQAPPCVGQGPLFFDKQTRVNHGLGPPKASRGVHDPGKFSYPMPPPRVPPLLQAPPLQKVLDLPPKISHDLGYSHPPG